MRSPLHPGGGGCQPDLTIGLKPTPCIRPLPPDFLESPGSCLALAKLLVLARLGPAAFSKGQAGDKDVRVKKGHDSAHRKPRSEN